MKKIIFITILIIVLILALFLFANNGKKEENIDSKYTIVTSFYPIYIMALNVTDGANNVEVLNMADTNVGCLHDYTLTTTDMRKIENADIFIQNGLGLENFIDKLLNTYNNLKIVDTSANISEKIEDDGSVNPHLWTSIDNNIKQVQEISNALIENNPENSEIYKNNTEAYIDKLENIKENYKNKLQELNGKKVVCLNEAFEYLAKDTGLDLITIETDHNESTLSADKLKDVINTMKEENINNIIVDINDNLQNAETIANETGAQIYRLNSAMTGEIDKDSYINIMNENLQILEQIK